MQSTGVDSPTPRGSKPTRSKRAFTSSGSSSTRKWTDSIPEPPGPPGLTKSEPIRVASSVAGCRVERELDRPGRRLVVAQRHLDRPALPARVVVVLRRRAVLPLDRGRRGRRVRARGRAGRSRLRPGRAGRRGRHRHVAAGRAGAEEQDGGAQADEGSAPHGWPRLRAGSCRIARGPPPAGRLPSRSVVTPAALHLCRSLLLQVFGRGSGFRSWSVNRCTRERSARPAGAPARASVAPMAPRWVAPVAGGAAAAAGLAYVWAFDPAKGGVFIPCPFHRLTGRWCPGCGMTRALHDLLHGDLARRARRQPLPPGGRRARRLPLAVVAVAGDHRPAARRPPPRAERGVDRPGRARADLRRAPQPPAAPFNALAP